MILLIFGDSKLKLVLITCEEKKSNISSRLYRVLDLYAFFETTKIDFSHFFLINYIFTLTIFIDYCNWYLFLFSIINYEVDYNMLKNC